AASTLDPKSLADSLRTHAADKRAIILIVDELTSLSVLAELRNEGMLVFQPSTDEAVSQSEKRRSLPVHPLGIAIRRGDDELHSYMVEAIRTFLTFEVETNSASYEALYWCLVKHVRERLVFDDSLHIGGVRRVSLADLQPDLRDTLLDQNARAYARRCLGLS